LSSVDVDEVLPASAGGVELSPWSELDGLEVLSGDVVSVDEVPGVIVPLGDDVSVDELPEEVVLPDEVEPVAELSEDDVSVDEEELVERPWSASLLAGLPMLKVFISSMDTLPSWLVSTVANWSVSVGMLRASDWSSMLSRSRSAAENCSRIWLSPCCIL